MRGKLLLMLGAIIASGGLFISPASASVWTDSISYNGDPDVVQDNSVSTTIFDTGDGIFSVGDIIVGTIKFNINISDADPVGNHAIAFFAATITADNGVSGRTYGGQPAINFSVGAATPTLNALFPTITGGAVGPFPAGTLAVVMSRSGGPDPTTLPLGASGVPGTALDLIDSTYSPDLAVGFGSATDFFEVDVRDHQGPWVAGLPPALKTPDGIISITDTDADGFADEFDDFAGPGPGFGLLPGAALLGAEAGAFSVLADYTGPGASNYLLLPTTTLAGGTTGFSQILLAPSTTLVQPTTAQAGNGYAFADQSIVVLNAVPEPASMLVWAGLLGAGVFCRSRHRRKKAA